VPVSIVHVVRSPFDNISTLYRKHREHEDAFWATPTLDDAIRLYFNLCRRVLTIKATCGRFVHQVYGDDLITNRYGEIHRLLGFLDLEATPGYVDAAAKRIFTEPSRTRRQIDWQPRQIDEVYRCIEEVDFLDRYRSEPFHLPEAA